MIVFAAHVPHSPLILPSLAGDRIGAVKKTTTALTELAEELYARSPDTIILLTDHPTMFDDAFSLAVADPYVCSLEDVGDLGYHKRYYPDFTVIDRLQRVLRRKEAPLTLTTDERLNFSSAVPLECLTALETRARLVPLAPAKHLEPKEYFAFGQTLRHALDETKKRIALVSAGDLAQTLTEFSPGGFNARGEEYDTMIQTLVAEKNSVGLMQIDAELPHLVQETSYTKLLTLFGMLDGLQVAPNILSYEHPFGVGLLVVDFALA